jgi:hypothetical protein
MHEDGKWVRRLGIDGVVEAEVRRGGGGYDRWCRREAMGWPPFIVVPCMGATRIAQGEMKGGDGSVRR